MGRYARCLSGGVRVYEYRLYFFGGAEISGVHEFTAADDETAMLVAQNNRKGRKAELWCRDRRIKSWSDGLD